MKPLKALNSPSYTQQNKAQYIMKQAFSNFNALTKFSTKEEIERSRGNLETAKHWELEKYKATARLELSLRSLQHELYNEPDEDD